MRADATAKRAIFRDGTIDFSDCKDEMGILGSTERSVCDDTGHLERHGRQMFDEIHRISGALK